MVRVRIRVRVPYECRTYEYPARIFVQIPININCQSDTWWLYVVVKIHRIHRSH